MTKVGEKLWESHCLTFFQPAPLSALLVESDANPSSGTVRVSGAGKMVQERITLSTPCPFLQLLPLQHASQLWLEKRRPFVLTCWEVMGYGGGPQQGLQGAARPPAQRAHHSRGWQQWLPCSSAVTAVSEPPAPPLCKTRADSRQDQTQSTGFKVNQHSQDTASISYINTHIYT